MDLSPLPRPLRDNVQDHLDRRPKSAAVIASILQKRAAAPASEHDRLDGLLAYAIRPSRNGGLYLGLGIVALVVGIVGYQVLGARQHEAAVASGEPVVGKVTRLDPGNCVVGSKGNKCLQLGLELHPAGRPAYSATLTHDVPLQWMSRVQPGSWLVVAVDRTDPSKAYFDEKSMAVEPPQPVLP